VVKQLYLLLFLLGFSLTSFSQNAKEQLHVEKNPYGKNYKKPQMIYEIEFADGSRHGFGDCNLYQWVLRHTHYPDAARTAGIEGVVYVRFMIDEKGAISHIEVLKGIGGGCDEVAIRAIKSVPKWKPATYDHKPTKAIICLPIRFKLIV
jgi:TonB family protein